MFYYRQARFLETMHTVCFCFAMEDVCIHQNKHNLFFFYTINQDSLEILTFIACPRKNNRRKIKTFLKRKRFCRLSQTYHRTVVHKKNIGEHDEESESSELSQINL